MLKAINEPEAKIEKMTKKGEHRLRQEFILDSIRKAIGKRIG
ncbi:MAG: hypothetical protein QXZ44_01090 [Ferroplasma sp.]